MDWMAYFIGKTSLLPSQVMRLDAPVLQSLRNVSISGVHPAILLGWIAQIASHFASLSLDLLLCTAFMSLVLRSTPCISLAPPHENGEANAIDHSAPIRDSGADFSVCDESW